MATSRKPKQSNFKRKLLLGAALVGALHAPQAIHSARELLAPPPNGMQRIYSHEYAPFTIVYPHGKVERMTGEIDDPFKYTYVKNASRIVNEEVNKAIAEHVKSGKYPLAEKHVNAPYMHSTWTYESSNMPSAFFGSPRPTDVGLGQITKPALDQARQDGIVPKTLTRVEELMTLPHPNDMAAEKARWPFVLSDETYAKVHKVEIALLAKNLGKKNASDLTPEELARENETRIRNNIRISVHTAFNNMQIYLEKIKGKPVPTMRFMTPAEVMRSFRYLTYKDGGFGTARQFLAEGKKVNGVTRPGMKTARTPHDNKYMRGRDMLLDQARARMRFVTPPYAGFSPSPGANAIGLAPWLLPPLTRALLRRRKPQSAAKRRR